MESLCGMQIFSFNPIHLDQFLALLLEKYVPQISKDHKKDKVMDLEKHGMYVAAFEAKFHFLSRYAMQLANTEEERTHIFVKGLNSKLCVLSIHMTCAR